jgi:hypothetical protein
VTTSTELNFFNSFGGDVVVFSQRRREDVIQNHFVSKSNHNVEPAGVESNRTGFFTRLELPLDFESLGRIVVNVDPSLGCCGNQLLAHTNIHARYCG